MLLLIVCDISVAASLPVGRNCQVLVTLKLIPNSLLPYVYTFCCKVRK